MAFLAVLPSISTQIFVEPLLFALKGIPHVNMKKNPIDNAHFFTFFTTLGLIWPKFPPKTTPTLIFLLVSNEIC